MVVKNWSDGDFVFGADLDDIASSVVMRFPDAATRDAKLTGDLAPKTGMMCFLADTQTPQQYIVVSAVGYWAPMPGTEICNVYQTAAVQPLTSTVTPVPMAGVVKNLNGWWAATKFTPKVPGYYVLGGGLYFAGNATGYRELLMRQNGNINPPGSVGVLPSPTALAFTLVARPIAVYLNGTTDYIEICAWQNSGAGLDLLVAAGFSSSFNAVYGGLA